MNQSRKDEEKILSPEFLDEIKRVRTERGISIEEIAERINIKAQYIKAIEEGDLARLPGGIYNKAYIKSVSEFLGINMKPYERSVEADEIVKEREVRIELGRPTNASIPSKVTIIGCLFVIFVLYSLFYGPRVSKKEQIHNAIENYTDTQNDKAKEQLKVATTPEEKVAVQAELQSKVGDQAALVKQIPQVSPIQRETQDYVGKELVITLLATAKNKVTVKDSYGKVVLSKDLDASEAAMLNGSSEYYVTADNIANLDMFLDGVQIKDINKIPKSGNAYILKAEDLVETIEPKNPAPVATVTPAAGAVAVGVPAVTIAPAPTAIAAPTATATTAPATPAATKNTGTKELQISPNAIKQPGTNANSTQNNKPGSGR